MVDSCASHAFCIANALFETNLSPSSKV